MSCLQEDMAFQSKMFLAVKNSILDLSGDLVGSSNITQS